MACRIDDGDDEKKALFYMVAAMMDSTEAVRCGSMDSCRCPIAVARYFNRLRVLTRSWASC